MSRRENHLEDDRTPPARRAARGDGAAFRELVKRHAGLAPGTADRRSGGRKPLAEAWIEAREPAAAWAWAQAVNGEGARAAVLKNITIQIHRRYPDTWRAMLKEAGVSIAEEPAAKPNSEG